MAKISEADQHSVNLYRLEMAKRAAKRNQMDAEVRAAVERVMAREAERAKGGRPRNARGPGIVVGKPAREA